MGIKIIFDYIMDQLNSFSFKCEHRIKPEHFSRTSKLCFKNTLLIILRMVKKAASTEIANFFYDAGLGGLAPSRQAFALQREKISYTAIAHFFEKTCEVLLQQSLSLTFNGYRLLACDGTSFLVGIMEEMMSFFGNTSTVLGKAQCRISGIVDVLGHFIVSATVSPFSVGERALVIEQIKQLAHVKNALFLFDRGYWSMDLIHQIIAQEQKFLLRVSTTAIKGTSESGHGFIERKGHTLRYFSFVLPNGVREILVTNLPVSEFCDQDLANLYARRWGIETKYLELKHSLGLNYLSGRSVNVALQDIYSTLFFSNLVALACLDADIEFSADHHSCKHRKKANRSYCISLLRDRFAPFFCRQGRQRIFKELTHIHFLLLRNPICEKSSKHRPRKRVKPGNNLKLSPFPSL